MLSTFVKYMIALALIVFGTFLVLENIGIATFNMQTAWFYFYPTLFIVFGLKALFEGIRYRGDSWIWGSFLGLFGSLLLLDRFGILQFGFWDVFKLWPLLIIYIGFTLIRGKSRIIIVGSNRTKEKGWARNRHGYSKDKFDKQGEGSFAMAGNFEYNQPNWMVRPLNLRSMAGDFYFDFTKAFIPEKETPIRISALAGDVHILIPENIAFRMEARVHAGEIKVMDQTADGVSREMFYETPDYEVSEKKLDFHIKLNFGSIRIDYV